jgi:hypothetical protein
MSEVTTIVIQNRSKWFVPELMVIYIDNNIIG